MGCEIWIYFPDIKDKNFEKCLKTILNGGFGTIQLPFSKLKNYLTENIINMIAEGNSNLKLAITVRYSKIFIFRFHRILLTK